VLHHRSEGAQPCEVGVVGWRLADDIYVLTLPITICMPIRYSLASFSAGIAVNELGLEVGGVMPWFAVGPQQGYTRVTVSAAHAATWEGLLSDAVRRCYISDERLAAAAAAANSTQSAILAVLLPDPGSVMSGDFGEIVGYLYLASRQTGAIGPKKWRLKQDRTKAAPHSDIVQFLLPQWPEASAQDRLVCGEAKAKATVGNFAPIPAAIAGSQKDRTSRLSRTLVWLRERALLQDIGAVTVDQLNRFINATEFPPCIREFHAIAVICSDLVETELANLVPATIPNGCALAVISIPNLHNTYTTVFEAVHQSVDAVPEALP
jgi:uncharacterized protein DUF1837